MSEIRLRVQLFDQGVLPHLCTRPIHGSDLVWRTGDRLTGQIVVSAPADSPLGTLAVFLIGYHRVLLWDSGPEEVPIITWTTSKFLHQNLDIPSPTKQADKNDGLAEYTSSFGVTIPEQIVTEIDGVPDQCLLLPPSMTAGDVFERRQGEKFAQPRVEYRIRAVMKSTVDGSSSVMIAQTDELITIMPCSEPCPPINTSDFPDEFIHSVTHPFRKSYLDPRYQMTLSMPEPTPVSTQARFPHSVTNLRLQVQIEAFTGKKGGMPKSLCSMLDNLRFQTSLSLRAKTFYAIKAFSQMPGHTMGVAHDRPNSHESVYKIQTVQKRSSSWQPHFHSEASPSGGESALRLTSASLAPEVELFRQSQTESRINQWSTTVEIPLPIHGALIPTFCSAIASRQYSVIARTKVKGGRSKEFLLEVPLQIHCWPRYRMSPSAGNNQRAAEENPNENGTRLGAGDQASDLGVDYVTDEILPNYS